MKHLYSVFLSDFEIKRREETYIHIPKNANTTAGEEKKPSPSRFSFLF